MLVFIDESSEINEEDFETLYNDLFFEKMAEDEESIINDGGNNEKELENGN